MKQGIQIQLADAIITNGTMVQLPPNANLGELRNALCAVRTDLIQCIIPPTLTMRDKGACVDKREFNFAEGQIVNRINALQSVCGAGNLSPASECIKTLKPDMQDCHNKVGFEKTMFVSNSSAVKGALIGRDKPSAVKFCASRLELYECMRGVIDACPGAREYMLLTGYDHDSMEKSIEVLCQDIDVYVNGLSCFQEPPPSVIGCFDSMMSKMIELTAQEIENAVDKDKYFKEYCKVRVEHLQCDMKGWKDKCPADSVGLKNEHECTLLPARCQKDASLNQQLGSVCKTSNFERKLRQLQAGQGENSAGTVYSSFVGTAIGLFFAVILSAL
ncbi:hypothetical protein KP79_PYT21638 [Mizuhopecten yessoensis]|uniref:Uncharacterized protein n=2 Tax=Mizuhopecten yessoensis TaxID=6573 RepID=A0A210Q3W3_MIZYE|nr:hypothetical protein KP79_PYT21638 [Mizuhopecten yessoensis]